jgi:translation initiation factor 2-alpha kinase 4
LIQQQNKQQGVEGGSRYHKEFQEIQLLGKGGGGEVWKVKNNLDRRAYAVKKILLNPTDKASNNRIRREVTTISSLLHKHIVRYYAAWVEKLTIPVAATGNSSSGNEIDKNVSTEQSLDLSHVDSLSEIQEVMSPPTAEPNVKETTSTTIMNFR